jgi:hypothetical protein
LVLDARRTLYSAAEHIAAEPAIVASTHACAANSVPATPIPPLRQRHHTHHGGNFRSVESTEAASISPLSFDAEVGWRLTSWTQSGGAQSRRTKAVLGEKATVGRARAPRQMVTQGGDGHDIDPVIPGQARRRRIEGRG